MREPRDTCREVTLPSGEPIRVRGAGVMGPDDVAALSTIVDAVRAMHAAEHPENPATEALWDRLRAAADARDLWMRDVAHECGVRPSVVTRIAQGIMPVEGDLATLERWLAERESSAL
jgi:hypothetical protein